MSQDAILPARYERIGAREDGVPIYELMWAETNTAYIPGGLLPKDIEHDSFYEDGNPDMINVRGSPRTATYNVRALINAQCTTDKNQSRIEAVLHNNARSLEYEHHTIAARILLAAVFYTASIPLGIISDTATKNAMKDPAVMQRAEKNAWDKAKDKSLDIAKKAIKPNTNFSVTIDDKSVAELSVKFQAESLKREATKAHYWGIAAGIIGTGGPLCIGILFLASLKYMFKTERNNKQLQKLRAKNNEARREIKTALGRLGPEPANLS